MGAAIAQWIRLCLPFSQPGFKSLAHHLHLYQSMFEMSNVENTKINIRGRDWPILTKEIVVCNFPNRF